MRQTFPPASPAAPIIPAEGGIQADFAPAGSVRRTPGPDHR